jgi:hypothetical protein
MVESEVFNLLLGSSAFNISFPWWMGILIVWELIWKAIALWKCGRNNQPVWFVFILVLNTFGILPIIYLLWFQKKEKAVRKKAKRKR